MSARSRLWLDLGMFATLVVAFNPAWTGLAVHEWLSLAAAIPLLVHVIVNWEATLRVVERLVDRLRHASAANVMVDSVLFVSTVGVMLSGVMVSQSIAGLLGVTTTPNALWVALHTFTAETTIALLLVHLALHWRWLTSVAFRLLPAAKPAPARVRATSMMPERTRVTSAAPTAPPPQPVRARY